MTKKDKKTNAKKSNRSQKQIARKTKLKNTNTKTKRVIKQKNNIGNVKKTCISKQNQPGGTPTT